MSKRRNYEYLPVMTNQGTIDDTPESRRIDTRPQSSPHVRAGMRGLHRDLDGTVIGGYGPDGTPFGTKRNARSTKSWRQPGASDGTQPAAPRVSGNTLAQRQNLFKQMEAAGSEGISNDMREKARGLGVNDDQFNAAALRIKNNGAYSQSAEKIAQKKREEQGIAAPQQPATPTAQGTAPAVAPQSNRPTSLGVSPRQPSDAYVREMVRIKQEQEAKKNAPSAARYGADVAKQNIEKMGVVDAAKDYFRRKHEDNAGRYEQENAIAQAALDKGVDEIKTSTPEWKKTMQSKQTTNPVVAARPKIPSIAPTSIPQMAAPDIAPPALTEAGAGDYYGGKQDFKKIRGNGVNLSGAGAEFKPASSWTQTPKANVGRDARMAAWKEHEKKQNSKEAFNDRYNKADAGVFAHDSVAGKAWKYAQAKYPK